MGAPIRATSHTLGSSEIATHLRGKCPRSCPSRLCFRAAKGVRRGFRRAFLLGSWQAGAETQLWNFPSHECAESAGFRPNRSQERQLRGAPPRPRRARLRFGRRKGCVFLVGVRWSVAVSAFRVVAKGGVRPQWGCQEDCQSINGQEGPLTTRLLTSPLDPMRRPEIQEHPHPIAMCMQSLSALGCEGEQRSARARTRGGGTQASL